MTISTKLSSSLPLTAAEAVSFALDHMEPFEATEFLTDWRDGTDLTSWLEAKHTDHRASLGDWEGHSVGSIQ